MRERKDSGVESIGTIPTNWSVRKFKTLAKLCNGREVRSEEGTIPVYGSGGVFKWTNTPLHIGESLLMGRKGTIDNPMLVNGSFWTVDTMFYTSDFFDVIGKYLYYCCKGTINYGYYKSGSVLPSMTQMEINNIFIPYTAIEEQKRIVETLDKKCSQVDALIANVQTQIEKLKVYKQSVITEVVTKGLDPTVPMKDSRVEWIGEIPEHWDVVKARRIITSTQNGITRRDLTESKGQIVLKLKNISANGNIDYSYINRIALSKKELETYALKDGDFLFVRVNGSKGLVGKCAIFTDNGAITAYNDHIIRVRINKLCSKAYFHYYLLSGVGKTEIEHHTSTSAGQYTISGEGLRDIWIVLPPKGIQATLCSFLDEKCAKIDRLIALKQSKIEKLNEYKKSLIYEYVTGKKEVS